MTDETDQSAQRLAKLDALIADGRNPYLIERFDRSRTAAEVVARYREIEAAAEISLDESQMLERFYDTAVPERQQDRVAGRIVAVNVMGKALFAHVEDASGCLQVYVRRDVVGEEAYAQFKDLDLGDIVGVVGHVFKTRTGEISLRVRSYRLLAKCLHPLPLAKEDADGKRHGGLADVEQRYRMRYVDLLVNHDARDVLLNRTRVVQALRRHLEQCGFIEVETPVLQAVAGGAAAKPFITHHNKLDYDFKLRISLELPLKRLIVGGLEKVFEIGRVFRNEGITARHNPEFTLLELYQAYTDLEGMMDLVEGLYEAACVAVNGKPSFTFRRELDTGEVVEELVDLSQRPWVRLPMLDGIARYAAITPDQLTDLDTARRACDRAGIASDQEHTVGGIIEKLHERFVQPHLIQPTFITDFPTETSPLAKKRLDDPSLTRRFEVYFAMQELGNAFSEINDPLDQRTRFENQLAQLALGDAEAHPMDDDFVRALEYGMPPTGGFGGGVDRLVMVLTGAQSIRDVIFFPLQRPERA